MPNYDIIKEEYLSNRTITLNSLASKYNISPSTISKNLKKMGVIIRSGNAKFNCNENYFSVIDSADKAYFLGLMGADGQVQGSKMRIDLNSDDIHILESFKLYLESEHQIHTYQTNNTTRPYSRLVIGSEKLCKDLAKYNIIPNKTFIFTFPNIPSEYYFHFIRGYFDGDGCLTRTKSTNKYLMSILGTKELLQKIQSILGLEHITLIQRFPERNNNNYTLQICGNQQIIKLLNMIYQESDDSIRLARKHLLFLELKNNSKSHSPSFSK